MKVQEKISSEKIRETLDGLSEGLKPIIDHLDVASLTQEDKDILLAELDKLEAKALEVKQAFA